MKIEGKKKKGESFTASSWPRALATLARTMPVPRLLRLDFLGFSPQSFLATQPTYVQ